MLLLIDNYDSFTYNLVHFLGDLGARCVVHRNDQITVADVEAMQPDRIVVSPGPCTPQDAGISIDLIRHFAGKVPVLGVCLGAQLLAAALGAAVTTGDAPEIGIGRVSLDDETSRQPSAFSGRSSSSLRSPV